MRPFRLSVIVIGTLFALSRAASAASPIATPTPTQNQATAQQKATPRATPQKSEEQKLPPVVVTATRIEQPIGEIGTTVTVVDSAQIESQKIESVDNVLRQVPGVSVTQSGSPGTVSDVSIRGSTPAQTLIMIDGVEVNAGATGQFDIANLNTDDLDRIEVLRGAGGALYGSQAIGGVVNLITQEGEGAPKVSLLSEGGNRATERQVLTVNGADGKLGYAAALSYFSTQGFQRINDNSDNLAGAFRLDYHLDHDTTLRAFARYNRSNVSLVDFSVFSGSPIDPTAHQRQEFMLFKGEVERRIGERLTARANAFYVRNNLRLNQTPYASNPSSETDRIPDEMRGANAEAVYSWNTGWRSLAGLDFKDRWVRSDSISVFPPFPTSVSLFRARRQEYAGYLEQEGSAFDGRILGTAGVRVDGNSQFGEEVSPAWSLAIPVREIGTTLRGSYSEGFRAPSFDELYFPFFGNKSLEPEISSEYDGGFTTTFGEWGSFAATYFSRRVHHLIVSVPCSTCLFGSQAGNAGRVDVQGVELVPSVGPFYGFTLSGGFTLLDQTHVSNGAATRPLRVPKKSAFGVAQYIRRANLLPSDKLILTLAYTFVGDRDDITASSTIQSHVAYHRFDAVASYEARVPWMFIADEQGFTRISNLFDRHYSEAFGFPAPPINFVAGIQIDFE